MTRNEKIKEKSEQITQLRGMLHNSNDDAIAYAVGEITEEEFAPIRVQRKAWRAQINVLEVEIKGLKG